MDESNEEVLTSEATREQLIEIWKMFLAECLRYMNETPPGKYRVNKLEVIRAFLKDNNMSIDGGHLEDIQQSLSKLAAMDLPFTTQR